MALKTFIRKLNCPMGQSIKGNVKERVVQTFGIMGGSPGLVVMGGDTCSEGRGFESKHHILYGPFFTFFCC